MELDAVILVDYQGNYDNFSFDIPGAQAGNFRPQVTAIEVTENGDIYVSHDASSWSDSASTVSALLSGMLKLNADGSADTSCMPAAKGRMWALSGNRIMVFHQFTFGVRAPVILDSNKRGLIRIFTSRADFGIWRQSAGGDVGRNETASLSVTAFGPNLTYQWFKNGAPINGAASSVLTLGAFTAANNGSYTVRISDGTRMQTSQPMVLDEVAEPVITTQPKNADALLGSAFTLAVGFRGAPTATFQWRKNGQDIMGQTGRSLNFASLQFSDAGRYSVVIGNGFGTVTSAAATLTVNEFTGSLVTAFTPLSFDNDVRVIVPLHSGAGNEVIVGGRFSSVGGVAHGKFVRLGDNGRGIGGAWSDASPGGANGIQLNEIEPLASGKFLIAGDHTSVQGNTQSRLSRINADGTFDNTFVGAAFNNNLYAAKELPNGKLLIGGDFTSPVAYLCRLNQDGTLDSGFNPGVSSGVQEIAIQPDGKIVIVGGFSPVGGVTAYNAARLNPDGSRDVSFSPVLNNTSQAPRAFTGLEPDGSVDGASNANILNGGSNANVQTIEKFGPDDYGIGGSFQTVGGETRLRFARIDGSGALKPGFIAKNIK